MWDGQALEPWTSISFTCDSVTQGQACICFFRDSTAKIATGKNWQVSLSPFVINPGEENGKSLQHSCLENLMNSVNKQKRRCHKFAVAFSDTPVMRELCRTWPDSSEHNVSF